MKFKRHLPILVAFAAGIVTSLIIKQVHAHNGNANLVHSCVKNNNGSIRIISTNDSCQNSETPLDWNAEGAPGLGGLIADLTNADLGGMDLRYSNLVGRNFVGTNLMTTVFVGADLSNAAFTNALMEGVQVTDAKFVSATFTNSNLLNAARADTADFTGATWINTICPDGTNSDDNGNTCQGHF